MLVSYLNTTQRHNTEDIDLKHRRESLKTRVPFMSLLHKISFKEHVLGSD